MAGEKQDKDKPNFYLIDPYFQEELAQVLTFGAKKYGPDNWKKVQMSRYIAALERHVNALKKGIIFDHESGLFTTAHIAANTMFIAYFIRRSYVQSDNHPSSCNASTRFSRIPSSHAYAEKAATDDSEG